MKKTVTINACIRAYTLKLSDLSKEGSLITKAKAV